MPARSIRGRSLTGGPVPQALWRGYALRKRSKCAKISAIRTSLRALSGEVREEDKLYRRTALALYHLLTYRHLSAVLEALRHLGEALCPQVLSEVACRVHAGPGGRGPRVALSLPLPRPSLQRWSRGCRRGAARTWPGAELCRSSSC